MTLKLAVGELGEKIRGVLNENDNDREAKLEIIKEWLKQEPHLPDEYDEHRLLSFLRGSKFSLERAKHRLDMYFTVRSMLPEFFKDRDVTRPELQEVLSIIQMPPLPDLTPEGRRVSILRAVSKDSPMLSIVDGFKLALMLGDIRLGEEEVYDGDVFICDAAKATPAHFANLTPTLAKKFFMCIQDVYPLRLKEFHIINVSSIAVATLQLVKPFFKPKFRNRIFIHSDVEGIYKHVPKEMLPSDYGGNVASMNYLHDAWVKKLESYTDWYEKEQCFKSNEALRINKPTNYDELFGVEGSFRLLTID